MFKKIISGIPWAIAAIALLSALWGWYHPTIRNVPGDTQYIEVPVPKPYKVISKQTVTVETIRVITKTEITEKWPDWFTGDPNQQLTAIGVVGPYRGKTQVASVINLGNGESRIVAKRLPIPLLGLDNTMHIGLTIGHGLALDGGWSFFRLGNGYISASGVVASSQGQTVTVVGARFKYEW